MEQEHVHKVYDKIAGHFSNTRYKPWPQVDKYMTGLPAGSVGIDVGAGNGKYMIYKHLQIFGCDMSVELCKIALEKRCFDSTADILHCDGQKLPYRPVMDFAISIAVVHHFSTPQRRIDAVKEILSRLRSKGTALIYVWALEQASSRRGWDKGMDQDVMVPWVEKDTGITYERYYHLYKEGELEQDILQAGGTIVEHGYERDNWWCVCSRDA